MGPEGPWLARVRGWFGGEIGQVEDLRDSGRGNADRLGDFGLIGDQAAIEEAVQADRQNLLAQSLHENAYSHDLGFKHLIEHTGLPFEPHAMFMAADIEERQTLYRKLAELIWSPQTRTEIANEQLS